MIMTVYIQLARRAQGIQNSTLEVGGRHEIPSLAEKLLAFDSCGRGAQIYLMMPSLVVDHSPGQIPLPRIVGKKNWN